jgi:hypothetical protein
MIHNNISTSGWWTDGEIPWNELDVCPMSFNESLHALDCFNNPGCTCKSIEPGDLRCSECGSIPSEIGYCTWCLEFENITFSCFHQNVNTYHLCKCHLYHKKKSLEHLLEHSRISTLEHHARTQVQNSKSSRSIKSMCRLSQIAFHLKLESSGS